MFLTLFCVTALAGLPTANADAVFWAPNFVQADEEGNFSFTAHLVAGDNCVGWTGYGYFGVENVEGGTWVDTFCVDPQPIPPGTDLTFEVSGQLSDPTMPGIVHSESYFCQGGGGNFETSVLAPAVPTEPGSWRTLKARYR
jgi:hypothetical protein